MTPMRRIAAILLALAATAASAQDFFIGDIGYEPEPPRSSLGPVVLASDGAMFYVFARNGMNRVRPDGTIVDPEPFGVYEMSMPTSAAYGNGMLVVTHSVNTSGYASAMTTSGEILWTNLVALDGSSVIYDGHDFIAVYRDNDDKEVMANVLGEGGFPARHVKLADIGEYAAGVPVVVRTDAGLLAVWREGDLLRSLLFDSNGPRGEPVTIGTGFQHGIGGNLTGTVAVASSGAGALALWTNVKPLAGGVPLIAQHLDAEGKPVAEPFEIPVTTAEEVRYARSPSALWDGSRYRLAWVAHDSAAQSFHIESAVVAPGANAVEMRETVISGGSALGTALAIASGQVAIAWTDYLRGGVRGKITDDDASLASADEKILRTEAYYALAPGAVWTGNQYVVAWARSRGRSPYDLVFRRFDRGGVALDAEPRILAAAANPNFPVRLASNGTETAMVWSSSYEVYVARINADGTLIDAQPRLVATTTRQAPVVDVASDGRRFLIVWTGDDAVQARRLSDGGAFVDANPLIVDTREASSVRVVYDGTRFIAAYQDEEVRVATISSTGAVGESNRVMDRDGDLALATNGSTTLIVSGRSFALAGPTLRDARVTIGPYTGTPNAVWTGSWFVVADDYEVMWVALTGEVGAAPIQQLPINGPRMALASAGDRTAMLVYTAPTRTFRAALYGRFLAPRRRAAGH